jgi:hypothetical protein
MPKQSIAKEVARGKKLFEDYSRMLERERERDRMLFPSLHPSSRKFVSPLDGRSPGVWSGTPERKSE